MSESSEPPESFDHRPILKTLTHRPGVYQMLNAATDVIYVGKAKDLKRRVSSYFTRSLNRRIQSMVSQVRDIQVTVTHTEAEALLLENNLIKSLRPRYNILLRDDKSYPYIHISEGDYPRLSRYRGAKRLHGETFGPYPSARAVRETLHLLQKLFPVRQCEDSSFRNRSRPCLQYQIKRCSAPCVEKISQQDYQQDLHDTRLFLRGRASDVTDRLLERMESAAEQLDFESAAKYRDQISALRQIQEKQHVMGESGHLDIVACAIDAGQACVQVFFVRHGRNLGNKPYFLKCSEQVAEAELMGSFLTQYYPGKILPPLILVSHLPDQKDLIETAFSEQAEHQVRIRHPERGERRRWLEMADHNAQLALKTRLSGTSGLRARTLALQEALSLDELPQRMECFDISHTSGQQTVASCVVFSEEGPLNADYRRFNIKGVVPGDDYGAMRQALRRRYTRVQEEGGQVPDIIFIDGGKGQLSIAAEMMQELLLADVRLIGVAKGPDRKPGMEQLFLLDRQQPLILPAQSSALHLIQHIRDESHRFAITGHRKQRAASRKTSTLEDISGVGPKRRQQLLRYFGGLQGLSRAGVDDIKKVEGISGILAQLVYDAFHGNESV